MAAPLARAALVLCMLCPLSAWAQDIGRIFSTPEQRSALERLRRGGPASAPAAALAASRAPGAAPAEAAPRALRAGEQVLLINGVVRRSGGGRETTWIDSVPYSGKERVAGGVALTRAGSNGEVALTLRSGKQVSVRAGQRVDAVSGSVAESYQPRREAPAPVREAEAP
jgi:hypothetical protein